MRQPGPTVTVQDIADHCRRVLPFSAVPKSIEFVDEIPRTASGKIRRHAIAGYFADRREQLFRENSASQGIETDVCAARKTDLSQRMKTDNLTGRVLDSANRVAGTNYRCRPTATSLEAFGLDSLTFFASFWIWSGAAASNSTTRCSITSVCAASAWRRHDALALRDVGGGKSRRRRESN